MINGIDHVVIAVNDIHAGIAAYRVVLGADTPAIRERDGITSALIIANNVAVEIMAPAGQSEVASRLRTAIEDGGEGLKSVAFAVTDIDRAHRRCERVGLAPEAIQQRETWRSFRIGAERANGARVFLLQRDAPLSGVHAEHVIGLDHLVIRSDDLERAAAFYGARLGLDLRLDREIAGRRLMFFRCGDAVIEIARDETVARDHIWGVSWRVADGPSFGATSGGGAERVWSATRQQTWHACVFSAERHVRRANIDDRSVGEKHRLGEIRAADTKRRLILIRRGGMFASASRRGSPWPTSRL